MKSNTEKINMKKYHVTYRSSTDHDCCTVWTMASSKQAAVEDIKNEYWDVESIIDVVEA